MSWVQLGLFLEAALPTQVSPKRKTRKPWRKAKTAKKPKAESKSKPIPKVKNPRYVTLKPGELDDDINF